MEKAAAKKDNLPALRNPGVQVNPVCVFVCVFVYRDSTSLSQGLDLFTSWPG